MGKLSASHIIEVFVAMLIGASLVGSIATITAAPGPNITGATLALYVLIPLFFVIIIIGVAAKYLK